MANLEKILEPFDIGLGRLQDFSTLLSQFKKHNIDIDEFILYADNIKNKIKKEQEEAGAKYTTKSPCPTCKAEMFLYPVNISPGTQTGDLTDKSVWMCQNTECMHTIYNKETVQEIIKSGGT